MIFHYSIPTQAIEVGSAAKLHLSRIIVLQTFYCVTTIVILLVRI